MNEKGDYEKPRKFRKRKTMKDLPRAVERIRPVHKPYHRENHGNLQHSLVIDGLGEDFGSDPTDLT